MDLSAIEVLANIEDRVQPDHTALLVVDMPYGSYHVSPEEAVRNAARYVKEAGAEAVKIEGGEKRADLIHRIIDAEIPVAGHIGPTPQSVNVMGGYRVQGKDLTAIERLMRDAVALDRAGVACIYLEGIPRGGRAGGDRRGGSGQWREGRGLGNRSRLGRGKDVAGAFHLPGVQVQV